MNAIDDERCCPDCGSPQVRRSHHRNIVERSFGRWFLREPYRCEICGSRFFLSVDKNLRIKRIPIAEHGFHGTHSQRHNPHNEAGWAKRNVLWLAGGSIFLILGGAFAVEIYGLRHSPVPPSPTARPRRQIVIGKIPSLSDPAPRK